MRELHAPPPTGEQLYDELNRLRFAIRLAVSQKEYEAILATAANAYSDDLVPLFARFLETGTIL